MRYKQKMLLLYTVLVLTLALVMGTLYYNYNFNHLHERGQQTVDDYARELTQQFDTSVRMMGYAIDNLTYDIDVYNALRMCARAHLNSYFGDDYTGAIRTLNAKLSSGLFGDFYRVIVFNRFGDAAGSRIGGLQPISANVTWKDIPWLDQVSNRGGAEALVGLHRDDWSRGGNPMVISYVKELQGSELGFIEVQRTQAQLDDYLRSRSDGSEAYLLDANGAVLYAAGERDADTVRALAGSVERGEAVQGYKAAINRSELTGCRVLAVLPDGAVAEQIRYVRLSAYAFIAALAAVSLIFVYAISTYLTKPIEQMEKVIGRTQIDNIGKPIGDDIDLRRIRSIVELDSLMNTYEHMTKRLAASIQAESEMEVMYMSAQFDALQAQVDPHFIFNILNVISQRGMAYEDDMICEICANLAAILRYSTNMKRRLATVGEELEYLSQYAFLQRARYRERFNYSCDADADVLKLEIPRLTIQQLVENCMRHGYSSEDSEMCIEVSATREGNCSVIRVHDCGRGFEPEKMAELKRRFAEIRESLLLTGKAPELEIGGMGLANVYARLYLTFGERFALRIRNDDGATVVIRIEDSDE